MNEDQYIELIKALRMHLRFSSIGLSTQSQLLEDLGHKEVARLGRFRATENEVAIDRADVVLKAYAAQEACVG